MGKGLETLVKGVLISSLLVAPVLSTDSDAAKRPRARAEAQTQTREQLRRSNLERYIQTYGHVEPNGQRMTDTAIANFYIPMMQQSVYDTLRNTNVREVTPENFDRMVYGDTRPKLVMFSRDMRGQTPDYSRGLASVFRALSVDCQTSSRPLPVIDW